MDVEQKPTAPTLAYAARSLFNCAVISVVIRFSRRGLKSPAFRPVHVDEFPLEMRHDEKRTRAEQGLDFCTHQLGQLGRIAVTLRRKLRYAKTPPHSNSRNRRTTAVRHGQDDRQHACPDSQPVSKLLILFGPSVG